MNEKAVDFEALLTSRKCEVIVDKSAEADYMVVLAEDTHIHHGIRNELISILQETPLDTLNPNKFNAIEIHAKTHAPQPCFCVEVKDDDTVVLAYRGDRKYPSPVILNRAPDSTLDITIIVKDSTELTGLTGLGHVYVVRTAYAGPVMPPEPLSDKIVSPDTSPDLKKQSLSVWGNPGSWKMALVPEPNEPLTFVNY